MQGRSPTGPHGSGAPSSWGQFSPTHPPVATSAAMQQLHLHASVVLQRVRELETALATQEWWLLGRHLREAQILAEEASLLAVARSELEDFLARLTGRSSTAMREADDDTALDPVLAPDDPQWLYDLFEQANAILRYLATSLPMLRQQAEVLHTEAGAMRLGPPLLDPLGVVVDRLRDAAEALGV